MEERQLIEAAKAGNRSATQTLFAQNYRFVSNYCIKMIGSIEKAQDIVQETFLRAVVHMEKVQPEKKFSTWLIAIATNLFRDELRKQKRKGQEPLEDTLESSDPTPEQTALLHIEYQELLDVLQVLSYEKRSAFILKHYYGFSYEEIAEMADCPIGTVRSRLHAAMKGITAELERRRLLP
ncbi:RNA polymerase sigma factor SigY [Brevibacillus sp. SYSU BS000544]|uniref:RNA polymerase sigma factor SigY n=1 Tax=Brevibacillus sp. SYSU BS000544 TaxID=3416443 RepID=UPI003CE48FFE